jgi:hypothetical protein
MKCTGVEWVSSCITFSLKPTASPSPGNSTSFDSSMILHHGWKQIPLIIQTPVNYSSPINVCNILYQLSIKPFNINVPDNANSQSRYLPF